MGGFKPRLRAGDAALSFSKLVCITLLFPPSSVKLLNWLLLPFLPLSDLTFEFLSLECLLFLATLKSVSNLFFLLFLAESLSWESELFGFLHSELQRREGEGGIDRMILASKKQ